MIKDLERLYDFCYEDIKSHNFFIVIDNLLFSAETLQELLEEIKYQFDDIEDIQEERAIYPWFYYYQNSDYTHILPSYLKYMVQFIGGKRLFNQFINGEFECVINYDNYDKVKKLDKMEDDRMKAVEIYIEGSKMEFSSVKEMVETIEEIYEINGVKNWISRGIPFKYSHLFSFEKSS